MRRGLGFDVGPLAQAQFTGALSPSFQPPVFYQPAYMPVGQTTSLPDNLYATDAFANQLASLLGGSVVQGPPPGNYQVAPGVQLPPADYVSVGGQQILPGNLFQPGTILSFQDECDAENYFVQSIPGAQLSATCAGGGTGLTPSQMAMGQPAAPAPAPVSAPIPAPVLPTHPVSRRISAPSPAPAAPPAPSNIVSGTAGSNVSAQTGGAPASSDVVLGGFDLSTVPWWGWALAGGALLWMVSK